MPDLVSSPAPDGYRRGVALRLAGMLAYGLLVALTKLISARGVGTIEIITYRNLFALPPVVGWAVAGPGLASLRTGRAGAHLARSALGLTAMFLAFQALVMLPLAEAVTISFTAPLFATLLSALLLGERVGPHRWAAVAIGLAGVVVILRPGAAAVADHLGVGVALIAALTIAFVTITLRQIGATEPATTTAFWFTLACAAATAPLLLLVARTHDRSTWALLALLGFAGGTQQLLNTAALRHAAVATLAPLDYTQLLWALLFGWLLLGTAPGVATLVGGALIVAGGLYTLVRERRLRIATAAGAEPMAM